MQDSVARATVAGLVGAIIMNTIMYLVIIFGVTTVHPWQVAADIFLTAEAIASPLGLIIGLIGTVALSIASALIIVLLLEWTGYDYALLKGVIVTNAIGFGTMGLFMPMLGITPQVQAQSVTNLLAILTLTIIGAVMAAIIGNYKVRAAN